MYRRREIAIDLTALLDVILIILFMFVVRTTTTTSETANVSTDEKGVSNQIEKLTEENTNLKKQITTNSILDDTCKVITITIEGDYVEDKQENDIRELNIATSSTKVEKITYNWDKLSYAKNKLKDRLKNYFDDVEDTNQMFLIVFQYDKNNIYNKDFKFVDSVLKEIETQKDEIYLAYFDTAAEEILDIDR